MLFGGVYNVYASLGWVLRFQAKNGERGREKGRGYRQGRVEMAPISKRESEQDSNTFEVQYLRVVEGSGIFIWQGVGPWTPE